MSEARDADRWRWLQRPLETMPGALSWGILVAPIWLSVSYPWLVAYIALGCGGYWLVRSAWCSAAAIVVAERIRRVTEVRWEDRLATLTDRPARREILLRQLAGLPARPGSAFGFNGLAVTRGERRRAAHELAALDAVDRVDPEPPPAADFVHVALIPTDTEPLHTLRQTIRALAEAEWPAARKVCAIVTRQADEGGKANVDTLRTEFSRAFAEFLHLQVPGDPGIAVGKRSAMAFGGRRLYRTLVRGRGMDPRRVLVTELDPDYRVHPQYFGYLTWVHLTTPERETAIYQPIPHFHNGLWQAALPLRLFAAALTQLQMWRSVLPERLRGFGSYAMPLQLLHRIGYWATDANVEDDRLFWRGYFSYGDRFRVVPLFIGISGDARRARAYWRSLAAGYLQGRRWAWGDADAQYLIDGAVRHEEIPLRSRIGRVLGLIGEHAAWAIAPLVVVFGAIIPLLPYPGSGGTELGRHLPLYASTILLAAAVLMLASLWVEWRIGPAKPAGWGLMRRGFSAVGWLGLPFVAVFFSNLPGIDARTRTLNGRYGTPPSGRG